MWGGVKCAMHPGSHSMNRRTILKLASLAAANAILAGCERAGAEHPKSSSQPASTEPSAMTPVKVKVFNKRGELVGPIEMPKVVKTDEQWKKQLTPDQYRIARGKDTERPFCGNLLDNHKEGVYSCVCCGLPLFSSDSKFNSGTGWPSFFQPVAAENVAEHQDLA